MKIEYTRNLQFGYMRIALSKPLNRTEEEMLSHNAIDGILPVHWQQENDKYLLRYDITRKQALDGLLENMLVNEHLLKSLLIGLCVAVKQLEKYLLPQEGLLLLPETIFWDDKTETMYFCYYPESQEPLQERVVQLLEYMLAKTDHKNILAVQLAYGAYEEAQRASFCIDTLQEYLYQHACTGKVREEPLWEADESLTALDSNHLLEETPRKIRKERNGRKTEWIDGMMAWIKGKIEKCPKRKQEEAVIIMNAEKVSEKEPATTVLGTYRNEIEGVLKYEGSHSLPDLMITKVPFVIGAASNCDGVIKHPNISRLHAKVSCQDGTYFIEDLNSTNGTIVNGGLLSYKTRVSLKKNESIYFANEPYRFL